MKIWLNYEDVVKGELGTGDWGLGIGKRHARSAIRHVQFATLPLCHPATLPPATCNSAPFNIVLKLKTMHLKILPELFGVLKLKPPQPFPDWLNGASTFFIAQTSDEYSIICPRTAIPKFIPFHDDWWCIRADGELAFDQVGVAASLSKPLANAGISIILVGTHDRDYVFVKDLDLAQAIEVYQTEGFSIE